MAKLVAAPVEHYKVLQNRVLIDVEKAKLIERECKHHGITQFTLEGSGYYRCKRCRSERVALQRRGNKARLVQEHGGACELCGYDRYIGAMHFHHRDPSTKEFGVAEAGRTLGLARLREEAKKCILLCANCHAEVEAGLSSIV